ncbi:sialoadhesin-like, partial [Oncorhynchus clarkii lewisi]|uniref:sialoadhesin-like n=1 Tax=Oncorhynchus clarkii lewisi TaxID=490388 RepID=UPI0039B92E52
SPPASLSISPDRSQFFKLESVSLSCEVQGNSAGWRVVRNTVSGERSDCGRKWGKPQRSSCIVSLIPSDSGMYWCESGSGEHSNAVNITVHAGAVILESPALPVTVGDSVTLRCRYQGTPSDLTADFYKDGSLIRTETTGEMTIPAVSKSDEGLYKCTNSEGESPESWMTVTDLSLPASMSVSPDRSQFFEYESVSLSCEDQGNSAGWRVVRNAERGILSECNTDWGEQQGSSCIVSLIPSDSGVYWCESGSGEHSNAVNITVHAGAVILESPALPVTEGDTVTLRCRYQGTLSDLTADFYKAGSLIRAETTGEMTIPAVSKSDEGLYKCTNSSSEGESPESWMTVTDLSLPASLSVSPDRSQFFEYESVSLSCEVQGNSAGWRVKRYTVSRERSDCGRKWGKPQGSSCIVSLIPSDSGMYWCESGSGKHSNAVNITVHAGAVILESPALPVTEGDSVTLRCRYQGTLSNHTADLYKDGSLIRAETTGEMTIPAVSESDEGLYKCTNSEGESPESWMTVTDLSLPASLSVSPDRSQFFEYESVSLSCEVQGNSAGWRVKRYTVSRERSDCGRKWGKPQGSSCIVSLIPSDSGMYWCESGSGKHSNAVNITVHAGAVILESPALPVTEGDSVTLRCRYQGTLSNHTADLYKDGSLIRAETTGEMTIPAVSESDEGLYKCTNSEGESPESWMTVTGPVPVLSMSLPRLLCSLLVGSPYLLVTIILLVKGCRSRAQGFPYSPQGLEYLLNAPFQVPPTAPRPPGAYNEDSFCMLEKPGFLYSPQEPLYGGFINVLFQLLTTIVPVPKNAKVSNTIIKFADDTTVVGLITDDDETAYREEVRDLQYSAKTTSSPQCEQDKGEDRRLQEK